MFYLTLGLPLVPGIEEMPILSIIKDLLSLNDVDGVSSILNDVAKEVGSIADTTLNKFKKRGLVENVAAVPKLGIHVLDKGRNIVNKFLYSKHGEGSFLEAYLFCLIL